MKPVLLLCLVVSMSAHAQAVRPAPVPVPRPPAYTPGYAPGTPPEPVYTPQGAGLPGEREPATVAPPVPRSKGRILPREPDGAPGLWAADGARASRSPPPDVFGIALPYPDNASPTERAIVDTCRYTFAMATHEAQQADVLSAQSFDIRACLASKAYALCAVGTTDDFNRSNQKEEFPPDTAQALERVQFHAFSLVDRYCKDVSIEPAVTAYRKVEKTWYKAAQEVRSRSKHH